MAKKTTRKYRQAKAAAKPAAKAAFPGKVKAGRRDPMAKYSAEDREIFKELQKETKGRYITTDKGEKVYVKPDETAKERIERERKEAMRKYRERIEAEDGPQEPKKKAPVKKAAAALEKKEPVKTVKKVGTVGTTKKPDAKGVAKAVEEAKAIKTTKKPGMTRAEKSAANKAAWAKMTPEERKNWKSSKPTAKPIKPRNTETPAKPIPKTAKGRANYGKYGTADEYAIEKNLEKEAKSAKAPKRPTLADLKKNEAAYLRQTKARLNAPAKPSSGYKANPTPPKKAVSKPRVKITIDSKTSTPAKPTAGQQAISKMEAEAKAKVAAKKATPKFRRTKAIGKAGLYGALAGEVVSLAKGSTKKDFKEINRLENKLAGLTGKNKSAATAARQGAGMQLSNLASLATMGIVGKTRRQRMDELNALINKAEAKKAKANKGLRYGKMGESLVPGTAAYKSGSKTKPTVTGGGSTSTATGGANSTGSSYTVKKGDTLSGIAKTAGVSLSEIKAANPKLMKDKKYKQGSMIWSGTKVRIPKK